MTADDYLFGILTRENVDRSLYSPVRNVQTVLNPIIASWAQNSLESISPSGSFAKGTANKSGTDIDLFISLSSSTPRTLKEIYELLFSTMNTHGYQPRRQNVSINITVNGYSVDLVPGKRQDTYSQDHSLYRRKVDSWTKTNIAKHIDYVQNSGRVNECRLLKLWRSQNNLDFPSFYVELSVISALSSSYGGLAANTMTALKYLRDSFVNARIIDPANTNNIISDDLTKAEKAVIARKAGIASSAANWGSIIK